MGDAFSSGTSFAGAAGPALSWRGSIRDDKVGLALAQSISAADRGDVTIARGPLA